MNWRDILIRAVKTFTQAFTAVLIAAGVGFLNIATVKAAAVAGLAALLSLIYNWSSNVELASLRRNASG